MKNKRYNKYLINELCTLATKILIIKSKSFTLLNFREVRTYVLDNSILAINQAQYIIEKKYSIVLPVDNAINSTRHNIYHATISILRTSRIYKLNIAQEKQRCTDWFTEVC